MLLSGCQCEKNHAVTVLFITSLYYCWHF